MGNWKCGDVDLIICDSRKLLQKSHNCFKATKNSLIWKTQETANALMLMIDECYSQYLC